MSRQRVFMLPPYAPRGDTSLHRCDSTPAWELLYRSIGASTSRLPGSVDHHHSLDQASTVRVFTPPSPTS